MGNPRVVIDHSDGEIKSITADQEIDVLVVDYDSKTLMESINSNDANCYLPGDFADITDPESAGVFSQADIITDPEFVNDVFDFTATESKLQSYNDLVLKFYKEGIETE